MRTVNLMENEDWLRTVIKDQAIQTVKKAGGIFLGFQNRRPVGREPLVLFNEPSFGTTLALSLSELTVDRAKEKLQKAVVKFTLPSI